MKIVKVSKERKDIKWRKEMYHFENTWPVISRENHNKNFGGYQNQVLLTQSNHQIKEKLGIPVDSRAELI